ncbi:MAG: hypothetical protein HFG48_00035 [Bacilli bacterium]|nr:hypothetical protein [Bacilli bacterium]
MSDKQRKKLLVYGVGGVIGLVVLIVILLLVYNMFFKKYSYSEIETIMRDAAVKYYEDNKDKLPVNIGSQISISDGELTNAGLMKDLSKYTGSGTICSGKVVITNVNYSYNYAPYLNCGDNYNTEELYKKILNTETVVSSGQGLYLNGDVYYYRGENPNNYVKFADHIWRIVKIDDSHRVQLILDDFLEKQVWDDRYNEDKSFAAGINDYRVSRIHDYLVNLYNSKFFSSSDRAMIADKNLCVGKRGEDTPSGSFNVECTDIMENQTIGLLPAYDFMNASLAKDCLTPTSGGCQNYNYLSTFDSNWWLVTADVEKSNNVYKCSSDLSLSSAHTTAYPRAVINIVGTARYVSGDGTKANPYMFK